MGGEYIIDSYLDWLYSDEYVYDDEIHQWVYIGDDKEYSINIKELESEV